MKVTRLLAVLLTVAVTFGVHAQNSIEKGWYFVNNVGYYKPMLADIRANQLHMRFYQDDAVQFSSSTKDGKHMFWDVAFAGEFPYLGKKTSDVDTSSWVNSTGFEFFVEGSAHMLLDFDAASSDVINTDFRFGTGIAGRFSWQKNFSYRFKYFHESTHIGDEFTLGAIGDTTFRRYNVSYQAIEAYLAFDRYFETTGVFPRIPYYRFYAGGRHMFEGILPDAEPYFWDFGFKDSTAYALKLADQFEWQLGGELFFRWALPTEHKSRENESEFCKFLVPQFWVLAADFYQRDRYDITNPELVWSTNFVLGVVYGNYFKGERTVKWLLNYYHGVHPHGQFRSTKMHSYWGLDYSISF